MLEDKEEYLKMSNASNTYGDGFACKKIEDILEKEVDNECQHWAKC